jgi:Protein of unknown function (DUF1439)
VKSYRSRRQLLHELVLFATSIFAHNLSFGYFESFFIPEFLINRYLMKQFPIQKNWLLFEINLTNPSLQTIPSSQELLLFCEISTHVMNNPTIQGILGLRSSYTFDAAAKTIALKNPRIDTFKVDGLDEKTGALIENLSQTIGGLFNGYVVYALSTDDVKKLKKTPSSIIVENGGIRLNFN